MQEARVCRRAPDRLAIPKASIYAQRVRHSANSELETWVFTFLLRYPKHRLKVGTHKAIRVYADESFFALRIRAMSYSDVVFRSNCEAPSVDPLTNAVTWSIFRQRQEAERYARCIRLNEGHELVAGHGHDSVAEYWWVGVCVPSISQWGHPKTINKHGRHSS